MVEAEAAEPGKGHQWIVLDWIWIEWSGAEWSGKNERNIDHHRNEAIVRNSNTIVGCVSLLCLGPAVELFLFS